jgi:hypothetical protein
LLFLWARPLSEAALALTVVRLPQHFPVERLD